MADLRDQTYFHVDMDAFFASVEIRDNPSLRDKPVLIGGKGPRTVVSTASYEARKYGCHSAMPMATALRLCPDAIVIEPRFRRYSDVSRQIMDIFRRYSDSILQISIDEAFLDMSGMRLLWKSSKEAALSLKKAVRDETGLTISVGIAASRYIAKMASDYDKPDGLCRVAPGKEQVFVDAVGLSRLWGIGDSTLRALKQKHITTTGELRAWPEDRLARAFGPSMGGFLYKAVRGIDPGIYQGEAKSRSLSTETTFPADISDETVLSQYLLAMSHDVMFRAIDDRLMARSVFLKLRWPDFSLHEAQITPPENLLSAEQVYSYALSLFHSRWKPGQKVRLLGLGLGNLYDGDRPEQAELFSAQNEKKRRLEKTILALRKRGQKVVKAATLDTRTREH